LRGDESPQKTPKSNTPNDQNSVSFYDRVSSSLAGYHREENKGFTPMMIGPMNNYDSSDENTSIVLGLRESFMDIGKYELSLKS
jgi:hypothetical protein